MFAIILLSFASPARAQEPAAEATATATVTAPTPTSTPSPSPSPSPSPTPPPTEAPSLTFEVTERRLDPARVAGSAHRLDETQLQVHEHDDAHRILLSVPGVYVRGEDGWGLRPNIGLRGANADRSAKVTLMEDGVLFAPAPYSAPAAYYFPLMTRMSAVEVFKGPAAVRYGPNTIGGAINLVTTDPPPPGPGAGEIDFAGGQYRSGKLHGRWGKSSTRGGVFVEGVHLRSDGFKQFDGRPRGDTGFDKNELMAKSFFALPGSAAFSQRLEAKVGYANEHSDETYLGLTDADFRRDPYRRYAGSARDRMGWRRTQAQVAHALATNTLDVRTTIYRHDLNRAWRKLNRFRGGPGLAEILAADTGQAGVYAAILRGDEDSTSDDQALMIGTNHRRFVSEGVMTDVRVRFATGSLFHEAQAGVRLHRDSIERNHTEDAFLMQSGRLVAEGTPTQTAARNRGEATALAVHAMDQILLGDVLVSPGVRAERIETGFLDRVTGDSTGAVDFVVLPGIGATWNVGARWSVLAGVHQGFSPVSPGQAAEVEPELSWNYEAGGRFTGDTTRAELIGFYNDYYNLTTECTFSTGCGDEPLNEQFNAGAVRVFGAEALAGHEQPLSWGMTLRVTAAWTWTRTEMLTAFLSENPTLGDVDEGDQLPYVPEHQGSLSGSLARGRVSATVSVAQVSAMREIAGQGRIPRGKRTDPQTILDGALHVTVGKHDSLYLKVDNALGADYLVSRRPFGARPGKPTQVMVGFRHRFSGP